MISRQPTKICLRSTKLKIGVLKLSTIWRRRQISDVDEVVVTAADEQADEEVDFVNGEAEDADNEEIEHADETLTSTSTRRPSTTVDFDSETSMKTSRYARRVTRN